MEPAWRLLRAANAAPPTRIVSERFRDAAVRHRHRELIGRRRDEHGRRITERDLARCRPCFEDLRHARLTRDRRRTIAPLEICELERDARRNQRDHDRGREHVPERVASHRSMMTKSTRAVTRCRGRPSWKLHLLRGNGPLGPISRRLLGRRLTRLSQSGPLSRFRRIEPRLRVIGWQRCLSLIHPA
jgi:hypothetical protein